jgi:predicted HD phosphohydrolase
MRGTDNHHDEAAAAWLGRWFGPEVTEPVRLHVAAKRYLCAVEPEYYDALSDASKYTMGVQGGLMSTDEADAFARQPYAEEAVALRRWDDLGKDPSSDELALESFREDIDAVDVTLRVSG